MERPNISSQTRGDEAPAAPGVALVVATVGLVTQADLAAHAGRPDVAGVLCMSSVSTSVMTGGEVREGPAAAPRNVKPRAVL
jgi:hypothetical protein